MRPIASRRSLLLALGAGAVALAAAPRLAAQQAAAAPRAPTMAVIDLERIKVESRMGKAYEARLDTLRREIDTERVKKQSQLNRLDSVIRVLQQDLERRIRALSADSLEQKQQELIRKGREREAFVQDGQREIQRMQERAQAQAQVFSEEFKDKIRPHIDAVVRERGIDILLDAEVTIHFGPTFDVSSEVIKKADAATPTAGR